MKILGYEHNDPFPKETNIGKNLKEKPKPFLIPKWSKLLHYSNTVERYFLNPIWTGKGGGGGGQMAIARFFLCSSETGFSLSSPNFVALIIII